MEQNFERFDMKKPPKRQSRLLQPLVWALSLPDVRRHKSVIEKIGCEDLKPPYLLLGNHNAFFDFKVATKAIFPHRANYVIAIDGCTLLEEEWKVCRFPFAVLRFKNTVVKPNSEFRRLWSLDNAFSASPLPLGLAAAAAVLGGLAFWLLHRRFGTDAGGTAAPSVLGSFEPVGPGQSGQASAGGL